MKNTDRLKSEFLKVREWVESGMDDIIPKVEEYPSIIHQSVRYSIFAGGKRIRPLLVYLSYLLFDKDFDKILSVACAVEMVHTYSLVHDDLPAMDDDDLRRGKPTNHRVFGEAVATLAGDTLLTMVFELLPERLLKKKFKPGTILEFFTLLAGNIGSRGLVGGQVVDIISQGKEISLETLEYIHKNKTSKLFEVCILGAAIFGNASKKEKQILKNFAYNFGMLFQIVDDILDVEGDTELLGKPVGSDTDLDKATYPALMGLDKAKDMAKEYRDNAILDLEKLKKKNTDILTDLTEYIFIRQE